jgi:hypothetical protein
LPHVDPSLIICVIKVEDLDLLGRSLNFKRKRTQPSAKGKPVARAVPTIADWQGGRDLEAEGAATSSKKRVRNT